MRPAATVLLLGVASALACACRAPSAAPIDLDAAIAAAHDVQLKEGPRAAVSLYDGILASARAQHDRRHEALALGHLGTAYKNLGEYAQALALHERALSIKRETGDEIEIAKTLSNIGLVEEARSHCPRALELYAQSLEIFTRLNAPRFAATVLNNQGLCYDDVGYYRQSVAVYERSLALHRQLGNEAGESHALGNLGGVDLLLGRYADAAASYEQSLVISTRLDDRQSMALDLINLGTARLGTGESRIAGLHLQRARTLAHDAGLLREEADAAKGVSQWLEQTGHYDDARKALVDATDIYSRAGLARERVDADSALGTLNLRTGDLARAASALERASAEAGRLHYDAGRLAAELALGQLELRRHNPDAAAKAAETVRKGAASAGDDASAASALMLLSTIRSAEGRLADGVTAARDAVAAAQKTKGPLVEADAIVALGDALLRAGDYRAALTQYDAAGGIEAIADAPDVQWRAVYGRGRALEGQGRLEMALAEYSRAVNVIEGVRSQLAHDSTRSGYLDDKRDVYSALVRLLLRLGRTREAFQAAERLRAQGYLQLITRSAILGSVGGGVLPTAALAHIRELQASVEGELRRPIEEQRGQAIALYRDELRTAEETWVKAVDALGSRSAIAKVLNPAAAVSATLVQRRLPPRAALVEYVVDRDETVAFMLTRAAVRAKILPVGRRTLRTRIELLRGLLARRETNGWQDAAERLDADLLAPLRRAGWLEGVQRLYLVPHAELNYLPFAVLRHPSPGGPRFLIDDSALITLPAAAALLQSGQPHATAKELFALAPASARLPFARQEVESLATLFRMPTRVLVGKDATEARFKQDAGHFRVVHLATHGFFNRVNPLFSGVELEAGGDDDGRLQVFEILGLPLGADLVTLSACDTALGAGELTDLPAGEELVGLTRAFLSAGGRNVVASLWDVSDRETASLMTDFYRAARTRSFAEALAHLQRQRAHSAGPEAQPWYWAAFIIAEGRAPAS